MAEIQGESSWVRVSRRFKLARVRVIRIPLYMYSHFPPWFGYLLLEILTICKSAFLWDDHGSGSLIQDQSDHGAPKEWRFHAWDLLPWQQARNTVAVCVNGLNGMQIVNENNLWLMHVVKLFRGICGWFSASRNDFFFLLIESNERKSHVQVHHPTS